MFRKTLIALIALAGVAAVACTPEQIALWESFTPDQQAGVLADASRKEAAKSAPQPGGDCYAAARQHFPQSEWQKAYQIINRESGGDPTAQNSRSSAAGCFQIIQGSWRHPGGVSYYEGRYNAYHNAAAARQMWNGNGWYCTCTWALTA